MYIFLFLVGVVTAVFPRFAGEGSSSASSGGAARRTAAARNLNNSSDGDFGVTWYDDPYFAYECTGLNLFGYSELCNEWTEVLQQKRVLRYLTPAGIDLALHYTVHKCYGLAFTILSTSKCIELLEGLRLNGADPCSTIDGYTPYDNYIYYTMAYPNLKILNLLICD